MTPTMMAVIAVFHFALPRQKQVSHSGVRFWEMARSKFWFGYVTTFIKKIN
jgi:hypothetical protein